MFYEFSWVLNNSLNYSSYEIIFKKQLTKDNSSGILNKNRTESQERQLHNNYSFIHIFLGISR